MEHFTEGEHDQRWQVLQMGSTRLKTEIWLLSFTRKGPSMALTCEVCSHWSLTEGNRAAKEALTRGLFCWPWWWSTHWRWFGLWVSERWDAPPYTVDVVEAVKRVFLPLKTLCSAPSSPDTPSSVSQEKRKSTQRKKQISVQVLSAHPSLLGTRDQFRERQFSTARSGGWFGADSGALHLLGPFVSNLMLPLIWLEVPSGL